MMAGAIIFAPMPPSREPDPPTTLLEDGAPEIVVEEDVRRAAEGGEGIDATAQKRGHRGTGKEAEKDLPRPREDHDEGDERALRLADVADVRKSRRPGQRSGARLRRHQRRHAPSCARRPRQLAGLRVCVRTLRTCRACCAYQPR